MEIQQLDPDGDLAATFVYDPSKKSIQVRHTQSSVASSASVRKRLVDVFLPAGYPASVTPDYTPYQIYDTLQAFASTIAGLLASRAVFVGMGVGSEDASLVTTMLLYIAQETIGRIATILFAHQFSQRIEAEVKFYRFFADIVNDIAFLLDCLSPGLPVLARVGTLCVSNACRAVCGVCASSKAILSSHFAREGNIGELNAKDGSQETVVSLIGMWLGGVLVSKVQGNLGTWACLLPLLALHLWANWKAVSSVRLTSLNHDRASILFTAALQGYVKNIDEVGKNESVLGLSRYSPLRSNTFRVGVSVADFLDHLSRSISDDDEKSKCFGSLLEVFEDEEYVLWCDIRSKSGAVMLKESATGETQAKALCHFLRALMTLSHSRQPHSHVTPNAAGDTLGKEPSHDKGNDTATVHRQVSRGDRFSELTDGGVDDDVPLVFRTLHQNRQEWKALRDQVEHAGWDLSLTNLSGGRCARLRTGPLRQQSKKDQ
jgi:hypothetical protein